MNLAEQLYQTVKPLPEQMVREVLDFALFLRQQEKSQKRQNLMLAQAKSVSDGNNAEDEPVLYSLADFKTISPITQSLIGLLANSNLDETEYKKHLENKYL